MCVGATKSCAGPGALTISAAAAFGACVGLPGPRAPPDHICKESPAVGRGSSWDTPCSKEGLHGVLIDDNVC